jgi:hypothetical protein
VPPLTTTLRASAKKVVALMIKARCRNLERSKGKELSVNLCPIAIDRMETMRHVP